LTFEIEELIKWVLGILVVVAVIVGVGFFFKDKVIAFFNGLSVPNKIFMSFK